MIIFIYYQDRLTLKVKKSLMNVFHLNFKNFLSRNEKVYLFNINTIFPEGAWPRYNIFFKLFS